MTLSIRINLFLNKNVTRKMWSCSRVSRYNDFPNEVDQKFFSLIIWIIKNLKRTDVKCHFFKRTIFVLFNWTKILFERLNR
jgi:hypothetical protein